MNKKQAWLELSIKYGKHFNFSVFDERSKLLLTAYCLGKGIINTVQEDNFYYNITNKCDYCHKSIDTVEEADMGTGYWSLGKGWTKYHKTCKHLKKENEIEQQKIDCNCNDCAYFKRNGSKTGSAIGGYDFKGYCEKLDKLTSGQSVPFCKAFENDECFKYRNE